MNDKPYPLTKVILGMILCFAMQPVVAAGKLSVEKETTVNASPETVWKMIGHFNHLDVWHPVIIASEIVKAEEGKSKRMRKRANKAGTVRILTTGDGGKLTEVLLKHSYKDKHYTYKITESPLPVMNYESTLSVIGTPDGKAVVKWICTFDAKDTTDEKAVEVITGIYEAGVGQIAKHFN